MGLVATEKKSDECKINLSEIRVLDWWDWLHQVKENKWNELSNKSARDTCIRLLGLAASHVHNRINFERLVWRDKTNLVVTGFVSMKMRWDGFVGRSCRQPSPHVMKDFGLSNVWVLCDLNAVNCIALTKRFLCKAIETKTIQVWYHIYWWALFLWSSVLWDSQQYLDFPWRSLSTNWEWRGSKRSKLAVMSYSLQSYGVLKQRDTTETNSSIYIAYSSLILLANW